MRGVALRGAGGGREVVQARPLAAGERRHVSYLTQSIVQRASAGRPGIRYHLELFRECRPLESRRQANTRGAGRVGAVSGFCLC